MYLSALVQMAREVASLFDEQIGRWNVPVMLTGLTAEMGQLSDRLLIQQARHT